METIHAKVEEGRVYSHMKGFTSDLRDIFSYTEDKEGKTGEMPAHFVGVPRSGVNSVSVLRRQSHLLGQEKKSWQ